MILAAGLGSRLKPFTLRSPKPLVPLLGVPTIEYSLLQLPNAGVKSVVVNVHSHADQLTEYLADMKHHPGLDVQISDERVKLLGSAGGFRKAISLLETTAGKSESFFALNADVVSEVNLKKLAARHQELQQKHGVVMTLCLAHGQTLAEQEGSYTEILVNESEGLITGFGAQKNRVPFYTGIGVFETEAFWHLTDGVPAEFAPHVLRPWIEKGKVGFFWMDDLWFDVGSPQLWWKAHFRMMNEVKKGLIPDFWKEAIDEGMKAGCFSEAQGVIDYHLKPKDSPAAKNYISWKGDRCDV